MSPSRVLLLLLLCYRVGFLLSSFRSLFFFPDGPNNVQQSLSLFFLYFIPFSSLAAVPLAAVAVCSPCRRQRTHAHCITISTIHTRYVLCCSLFLCTYSMEYTNINRLSLSYAPPFFDRLSCWGQNGTLWPLIYSVVCVECAEAALHWRPIEANSPRRTSAFSRSWLMAVALSMALFSSSSSSSSSLTGKYIHKEIEGDLYIDREAYGPL